MARTYKTKPVDLPLELYERLEERKRRERPYISFAAYVREILDQHCRRESAAIDFHTPKTEETISETYPLSAKMIKKPTKKPHEQRKTA